MVERIDGAERELNVALGIDVVEDFEHNVPQVLHVYVFVDDHNAFGEHSLAERPDRVHHFAGLAGVRLLDGDDHQVVKNALDGQVDVDEFRDGQLHQGQKHTLDGLTHVSVLLGRLAHDRGRVDRIFAVRNATDVE